MPSLPIISAKELIAVLHYLGFVIVRQRGSHIVLRKGSQGCVVPNHRELKTGTLAGILKQADISVEQFINALKRN